MGALKAIVDELKLIAIGDSDGNTGFSAVNSFSFEHINAVNWEDRGKKYPLILVDTDFSKQYIGKLKSNYLPEKVTYTFKFFFLDKYHTSERRSTEKEEKLDDLEIISEQYIAEIIRRSLSGDQTTFIITEKNSITGFGAEKVHNDNLAQVMVEVKILADSHCNLGTFDYA